MSSQGYWTTASAKHLKQIFEQLPADATEEQMEKAIFDGYPFGQRKMFPYKVWCRTVREWKAAWRKGYRINRKPQENA